MNNTALNLFYSAFQRLWWTVLALDVNKYSYVSNGLRTTKAMEDWNETYMNPRI